MHALFYVHFQHNEQNNYDTVLVEALNNFYFIVFLTRLVIVFHGHGLDNSSVDQSIETYQR